MNYTGDGSLAAEKSLGFFATFLEIKWLFWAEYTYGKIWSSVQFLEIFLMITVCTHLNLLSYKEGNIFLPHSKTLTVYLGAGRTTRLPFERRKEKDGRFSKM